MFVAAEPPALSRPTGHPPPQVGEGNDIPAFIGVSLLSSGEKAPKADEWRRFSLPKRSLSRNRRSSPTLLGTLRPSYQVALNRPSILQSDVSRFQSFFFVSRWFDRAVVARAARRGNPCGAWIFRNDKAPSRSVFGSRTPVIPGTVVIAPAKKQVPRSGRDARAPRFSREPMERGRPARNASRRLAYRRLFHRRAGELAAMTAHCERVALDLRRGAGNLAPGGVAPGVVPRHAGHSRRQVGVRVSMAARPDDVIGRKASPDFLEKTSAAPWVSSWS
jgi:hypothetical protein